MDIAITPDRSTAFVADSGSGSVTPIDLAIRTAGQSISTGKSQNAIAITPDGSTAYVVNEYTTP
jgi:DNA-binding beta-propeller fold protein YncE